MILCKSVFCVPSWQGQSCKRVLKIICSNSSKKLGDNMAKYKDSTDFPPALLSKPLGRYDTHLERHVWCVNKGKLLEILNKLRNMGFTTDLQGVSDVGLYTTQRYKSTDLDSLYCPPKSYKNIYLIALLNTNLDIEIAFNNGYICIKERYKSRWNCKEYSDIKSFLSSLRSTCCGSWILAKDYPATKHLVIISSNDRKKLAYVVKPIRSITFGYPIPVFSV